MWRPGWDCRGNPNQRRFRPFGDVSLFEKMLRINMLGDILAVESGYEEGCRWGARLSGRTFGGRTISKDEGAMQSNFV